MKSRCKPREHRDRRLRGGGHYQCATCGDVFPCRTLCDHLDCIVATGRPLPEHASDSARDALIAELRAIYPDNTFATAFEFGE